MKQVVSLNVGGMQYKVSPSLLDMHPNSRLAQVISEQWLSDPEEEVFVERDGVQFGFVLDYLQNDGHVILPVTVPKPSFLADLAYYGLENVDESKIVCKYDTTTRYLAHAVSAVHAAISTEISTDISPSMKDKSSSTHMNAEIKALEIHCGIVTLAEECAMRYLTSRGQLMIDIPDPYTNLPKPKDTIVCSYDKWMAILLLLCEGRTSILPHAQEECNQYLSQVGLEVVGAEEHADKGIIQVELRLIAI